MTRPIDIRLLVLFVAMNSVCAERIKDMIYMPVDGVAACFRKHNGTHQFGCSSSRAGSVGVIHLVEGSADLKWLEDNSTAGPYTVVMPFSMFTRENLHRLKATQNINGILLAANFSQPLPSDYSPEDTCPNRYSGYKKCNEAKPWNPLGSGLLMEDWPFPMFYMQNETLLGEIKDCFFKHNAHDVDKQTERPLCALEMQSFMFAAVDSETCLRRSTWPWNVNPTQFCDPLGDRNIHWPLGPITDDTESVILVTGRLDADSMFGLARGGSAVTSLVTVLATAHYMNVLNATVGKTNVVFSLFNGESFDYIGSSRLAYHLKEGNFKAIGGRDLGIEKIAAIIELGHLGGADGQLYMHANNHKGNDLIATLQNSLVLKDFTLEDSVPPASIQSFLAVKSDLPAVVISNYGEEFTNRYYHSLLDDARSVGFSDDGKLAESLAALATTLGDILYKQVTGNEAPMIDKSIVKDLITDMLSCYLFSAHCALFRAASPPGAKLTYDTLPLYVGVTRSPSPVTSLTGQLLVLLTGIQLPDMKASECNDNRFSWMLGYNFTGICINSTVNYSLAYSPAFTISGYDMKSGQYSTWTESVWSTLTVRMFLKPSPATERLSIILGSLVASFSFLVVWFINSRADLLFENRRGADC